VRRIRVRLLRYLITSLLWAASAMVLLWMASRGLPKALGIAVGMGLGLVIYIGSAYLTAALVVLVNRPRIAAATAIATAISTTHEQARTSSNE
jgi:hypothetical protein